MSNHGQDIASGRSGQEAAPFPCPSCKEPTLGQPVAGMAEVFVRPYKGTDDGPPVPRMLLSDVGLRKPVRTTEAVENAGRSSARTEDCDICVDQPERHGQTVFEPRASFALRSLHLSPESAVSLQPNTGTGPELLNVRPSAPWFEGRAHIQARHGQIRSHGLANIPTHYSEDGETLIGRVVSAPWIERAVPGSPLQAGSEGPVTDTEEYVPHHSDDFAEELGQQDGAWPPYRGGPSPLKSLSCGDEVRYEQKASFNYARVVKEQAVDVTSLSGNWVSPPYLSNNPAADFRHRDGRPLEEIEKVKEKLAAARTEAAGMVSDMMRSKELEAIDEYYTKNLSKRAIDRYLRDLTSDTKCEPGCDRIVILEEWYALLNASFDTDVDFRLAKAQPVDLGPDQFLWDIFAQVTVSVVATVHCIFTVKCVEHSF